MNAAPNPVDPPMGPQGAPAISAAADRARAELHAEIERVRIGVEEVLAEQSGPVDAEIERELANLREDTRLYVKKRIRRSEKKLGRSVEKVERRSRRSTSAPASSRRGSTRSRPTERPPRFGSTATPSACSMGCWPRCGRSRTC